MKNFIRKKENFVCDPPTQKASEGRRNFMKRKEMFVCERCSYTVKGNGYTDHCPKCLWGKHVDDQIPGDRASECRELMEPVETIYEKGDFRIHHKCTKCRHEFWVKCSTEDDRNELVKLIRG